MTKFIIKRVTKSFTSTGSSPNTGSENSTTTTNTGASSSPATSNTSNPQSQSQQTNPQNNVANETSNVANEANNVAKETNTVAKEAGTVAKEAGEAENVAKNVAKSGGFKRALSFMNRNKGKMLLGGLALGGLATLWAGHKTKKYVTGGMGDKNSGVRDFNGRYVY